jgi:hypothetical protein
MQMVVEVGALTWSVTSLLTLQLDTAASEVAAAVAAGVAVVVQQLFAAAVLAAVCEQSSRKTHKISESAERTSRR